MSGEYKLTHEALLPHIGYKQRLPLFERFEQESINELVEAYATNAYPGASIACGLVCAGTYNIIRTADDLMQTYCRNFRSKGHGQTTCLASDYLGSALAILLDTPVVYRCGGNVFDFTVPLRSTNKKIFGVFINGQARPEPLDTNWLRSLCGRHRWWGTDVIESYIDMPVLNSERAQSVIDFLKTEFAELLKRHNGKSHRPDLDISAFRSDIEILQELFLKAVDRPAWRVYEIMEKDQLLKSLPMVTPRLDRSETAGANGDRNYCNLVLKPGDELYAHLQGEVSIGLGTESVKSLYACYDEVSKGHDGIGELKETHEIVELMENIRNSMVAPEYSSRASDTSSRQDVRKRFNELLRGQNGRRWFGGTIQGMDDEALLSVRMEANGLREKEYEALREVSKVAERYFRRTELAGNLRDAFSEGDQQRRMSKLHRAREQISELQKPESGLEVEWREILNLLSVEVAAVKNLDSVTQMYAAPFRNILTPLLSSPVYRSGPADYAKCLLEYHPFSEKEKLDKADIVSLNNVTERLSTQFLERDLSEDVFDSLEWLGSLDE